MDEIYIIGTFVVIIVPVVISFLQIVDKSNEKTSELTKVITRLNDKLDMLFATDERHNNTLQDHEKRIGQLEHDVTVVQNEVKHFDKIE